MSRITSVIIVLFIFLKTTVTAYPVGSHDKFKILGIWLNELIEYYQLPGICAGIVCDQKLIWSKGVGYSDIENGKPFLPTSLFRIASITKLFTSIAIMQLRDEGKLKLDDPVEMHLPWFKIQNSFIKGPPVTIRGILMHTSGLPREAKFPYWTDHRFPTMDEIKDSLGFQEMIFEPESKWKYSNLGMALLGKIIELKSGISYEQFIQMHILDPAEMNSTRVILSDEDKANLAQGYLRRLNDLPRQRAPFTESGGLNAAANISSTVEDLARFISQQFMIGDSAESGILKSSTIKEMQRIQWLNEEWTGGYGLGFSINKVGNDVMIGHGGFIAGYRSQILFSPESKLGVIVLINTEDFSPFTIARTLMKNASEIIESPVSASEINRFGSLTGRYSDPTHWYSDVVEVEGDLYLYEHDYPPASDPLDEIIYLEQTDIRKFRKTGKNGNGEQIIFETDQNGRIYRIKNGENYLYPLNAD